MNLKTVYHYTYFIYPFLVNQERYKDFIGKFLQDEEKWSFTIHEHSVDLSTHAYFLPYVKKFLFPTLYWSNEYKEQFREMNYKKKLDVISRLTSQSFEYKIKENYIKNYKSKDDSLSFKIPRIQLICFEQGIGFLIIKTVLDKDIGVYSDDILDFNYRFRTINPRYLKRKKTEGMFLENQEFHGLENLSSFIEGLLYGYEDVETENIYFDRLFTYSYMCLDEKEWNEESELSGIINEFYKFQYVLPSEYGSTFAPDFKGVKDNTYSRWKYSIYGFSRESGVVFSSEREKFNSTKLPNYFENMYFYIFILAFYQRIALILFSQELMTGGMKNIERLKDKLTRFTHFSWFSQISNSEQGMDIWKKWQKSFDLPALFEEVHKEYEEYYDYAVARGQERINWLLIVVYTVSVVFSGVVLLVDFNIVDRKNEFMKLLVEASLGLTVLLYPAYVMFKGFRKWLWKKTHNGML